MQRPYKTLFALPIDWINIKININIHPSTRTVSEFPHMMLHSLPDRTSKTSSMDIESGEFTSIHESINTTEMAKTMNMEEFLL